MLRSIFQKGPELKSHRELVLMREAGKIVAEAHRICREMVQPGVQTIEIDRAVEALYTRHGVTPLFKGYPGPKVPFPACTCISINNEVVHGIPGKRVIKEGDMVKIDTACKRKGWCGDAANTYWAGELTPERKRLVDIGNEVLNIAIREMSRRRWWSEVAREMQKCAETAGFSVVRQFVGHGIGRIMHENPQVPNYISKDFRKQDFRLQEGLVLAVEPMVNMGKHDVRVMPDHWTVVTRDGMPSVHVEHTLALTRNGVQIITHDDEVVV